MVRWDKQLRRRRTDREMTLLFQEILVCDITTWMIMRKGNYRRSSTRLLSPSFIVDVVENVPKNGLTIIVTADQSVVNESQTKRVCHVMRGERNDIKGRQNARRECISSSRSPFVAKCYTGNESLKERLLDDHTFEVWVSPQTKEQDFAERYSLFNGRLALTQWHY